MGHFLVGVLLVIIIANSGWFLFFNNKAANKKAKIEDSLRQLEALMNLKRDLLNIKTQDEPIEATQESDLDIWQQAEELEEKLALMQQLFNEEVLSYNKYINAFPNAIASKIMNIKELPLGPYSLNNSEEAIKRCIL